MRNIYEPDFVKKLFNQMSSSYDRMNYITSFGFSIRWRKQFLHKLGRSEQHVQVLDLLSGLGENWNVLKKNYPNAEFSALDFSDQMINQSQSKGKKIFGESLTLYCEDLLKNQLPSSHYDVISCAYGLKTFNEEQWKPIAKEISRILKPGGKFSFVEVSLPKNPFLLASYSLYLKKCIPLMGKIFLGNPQDYKMLFVYTKEFKNCRKVQEIFERQGMKTNYHSYFFGCATGISGEKPNA